MIKHLFTSNAPDDANASNVQGRHWNQDHTVDDPAALTAVLSVFSNSLKGLVPASGGGVSNFLRADGIWASPAGAFFDSILTPPIISPPGVGDWNVGVLGHITLILLTADGSQPVHGLVGGADGKIAVLLNVSNPSSSTPFFQHESSGASPANRFINMGGGAANGSGSAGCLAYYYHGASSRWRNIWST